MTIVGRQLLYQLSKTCNNLVCKDIFVILWTEKMYWSWTIFFCTRYGWNSLHVYVLISNMSLWAIVLQGTHQIQFFLQWWHINEIWTIL